MTEQPKQEKKSLAETMSAFMGGEESTPVDVAMELLNPRNAVMHTQIKNVGMMNKLALMIECAEDDEEREFWQVLYDKNILHPVAGKNRERAKEIGGLFAGLQTWYSSMNGQPMQEQGKKGLFGRR